jgi:ribose 5-phosphate isomerase A
MPSASTDARRLAERAMEFVPDGSVVGLGSGRAASAFIRVLGGRVERGFRARGVPTSEASAGLARQLGIPLVDLTHVVAIDVDVDGADEVDPKCDLIKGLGGALLREKIVAAASRHVVILVGAEKLVPVLGTRGILPIEVIPFGRPYCEQRLVALGCDPRQRLVDGKPFVTDNGNHIIDCRIAPIERPHEFERILAEIPGVVGTGLFLGLAHTVLIGNGETIEVRRR